MLSSSSSLRLHDPLPWRCGGDPTIHETLREAMGPDELAWSAATVPGWCTVFVAATRRGLTRLQLLPDVDAAPRAVDRAEAGWSGHRVRRDPHALQPVFEAVVRFLGDPRSETLDLPLELLGSSLEHRAWFAVRGIPSGHTVTTSDLAAMLACPSASESVAAAVAANPVALAIPCHRIVDPGEDLTAPGWAVEMKRRLLAAEAPATSH